MSTNNLHFLELIEAKTMEDKPSDEEEDEELRCPIWCVALFLASISLICESILGGLSKALIIVRFVLQLVAFSICRGNRLRACILWQLPRSALKAE